MSQSETKRYVTCTTAGPMFVYVRDGRMVRTEPIHFDEPDFKPWSLTKNGKVYSPSNKHPLMQWGHTARNWVYSNRVEYPMKRIDWDPEGERNPQNRGKSGYERISWDEAIDIVVSEIEKSKDANGNASGIFTGMSGHPEWGSIHYSSDADRFWTLIGTTPWRFTPISWEGWFSGATFVFGYFFSFGVIPAPDIMQDITNDSDMIVLWGNDPFTKTVYSGLDLPRAFQFWRELGKKIIMIEPWANDTGMVCGDKWIPIIPGTDAALAEAIAWVWIDEGTYDKAYLSTHAVGFDEETLPEGAPAGASFKNYILGIQDGVPKDPAYAEAITGIPSRIIYELAREWAAKPTCLMGMLGGQCRRAYAHETARLMVTLQAMQGLGKPGVSIVTGCTNIAAKHDSRQLSVPGYADGGMNFLAGPPEEKVRQAVLDLAIEDALNKNKPVKQECGTMYKTGFAGEGFWTEYEYPCEGEKPIRMIWWRGSTVGNDPDYARIIRLYQNPSIETVVINAPWFDRDCRYADLVLPATTLFETEDVTEPGKCGVYVPPYGINARCEVYSQKCIEPVGESKTDIEIFEAVAEKLGCLQDYTLGNSLEDWLRLLYGTTNVPMTFEEFREKGYYVWPDLEDYKPNKQLKGFYEDPVANPLFTPSGKLEIYSMTLQMKYGMDNPDIGPTPRYIPEWEGRYTTELVDRFPLQLLPGHPKYRFHGKFNGSSWLRECYKVMGPDGYEYEPVYMHPTDLAARGLKDGQIVRMFNDRGQILAGVVATERVIPGVARCSYGSWYDPLEPTPEGLDRGGEVNRLTPSRPMSGHHFGWASNSALIQVEAADLEGLAEAYPEGWAGKYNSANKGEM